MLFKKIITSSTLSEGENIMNIDSHKTRFNHEEWLAQLYQLIDTARHFFNEILKGLRALLQQGLLKVLKNTQSTISHLTPQDFIVATLITVTGLFGVMIFIAGLGLFGYQTMLWLQDGTWTEFPLFLVFNFLFENTVLHQWMLQPESWLGLQKLFSWILEYTPLSLALMIPGISIALFMTGTLMAVLIYRLYQLKNKNG